MPKKSTLRRLLVACSFASLIATGCYSSQQLVQPALSHKVSSDPAFLDNVTLASTNNSLALSTRSIRSTTPNYTKPGYKNTVLSAIQEKYASLLNVVPEAISNANLYRFVDEWYGVRYRLGGNDKSGIDCSAFVMQMYSAVFGFDLLRTAAEQFQSTCRMVWNPEELKEGDLVFFKIRTKRISHVGIYLMNRFFVHASSSQGVMISSLNDKYWQKYYAGAGRML